MDVDGSIDLGEANSRGVQMLAGQRRLAKLGVMTTSAGAMDVVLAPDSSPLLRVNSILFSPFNECLIQRTNCDQYFRIIGV